MEYGLRFAFETLKESAGGGEGSIRVLGFMPQGAIIMKCVSCVNWKETGQAISKYQVPNNIRKCFDNLDQSGIVIIVVHAVAKLLVKILNNLVFRVDMRPPRNIYQ